MESFPIFGEIGLAMSVVFQHRFVSPHRHHWLSEVYILPAILPPKVAFLLKHAEQCDQIFQTRLDSNISMTESYGENLELLWVVEG